MTTRGAILWDEGLLGYDLGGAHPLNPVRLDLTIRLARSLGVLDGVTMLPPEPCPDEELRRIHTASYLDAVKSAPDARRPVGHGLGTSDNPIFDRMHEASALVAGSSLLGASKIVSGEVDRAVNIAGGLHHAMPDYASGFCVYNDPAPAIAWLLDHGVKRA